MSTISPLGNLCRVGVFFYVSKSFALYSALVSITVHFKTSPSQTFHEESSKTEYIWNSASYDLVVSQEGSKRFCSVSIINYFFERADS